MKACQADMELDTGIRPADFYVSGVFMGYEWLALAAAS